jgi:hypothetical protein
MQDKLPTGALRSPGYDSATTPDMAFSMGDIELKFKMGSTKA